MRRGTSQLALALQAKRPSKPGPTHCDVLTYRLVGAGGAMAPPDFDRLISPISTRRGRLCPPITTGTPEFSDLPTALRQGREIECAKNMIHLTRHVKS